jgi:ribonucleoside-triphosphate reductase
MLSSINVTKRDSRIVKFNSTKIREAINKANRDVEDLSACITEDGIEEIIDVVVKNAGENDNSISVEQIQDIIEKELVSRGLYSLAKAYILYRYKHEVKRVSNTTDASILSLIRNENKELAEENSNKNTMLASTQRDYIAGEVSRDISQRMLLPERIVKAHKEGILHFHDLDYFIQPIFNCCLINIQDILDNGTVMNDKMIESPKSFQVACTVMTQVIAAVASNQYGGQSVSIKHLGKYLRKSRDKFYKEYSVLFDVNNPEDKKKLDAIVNIRLKDELKAGVQTIQYQINTLMTTNGQAPFVTLFLHLDPEDEYVEEVAMIIEEILRQRIEGIKNANGKYVTPAFPKLIYVLDEHNCFEGGKYDYLTEIAVDCTIKRMYPDYISAKIMREQHDGQVFGIMGCRSCLSLWKDENGKYKFDGRFNQGVVSINLPQIGIIANKDEDKFWKLFDERLDLCFDALMCRHKALEGTTSDISPIHWQYGAIARLKKGEKIDKLLHDGYSTISLGYIGLYEVTKLMKGVSHTDPVGKEFALRVMNHLREATERWKKETGLGFGLYGTPAESLCYRFAEIDRKKFGDIEDITDKGYYTNSYHVDVREQIDAFAKLKFEAEFQTISSGGAVSYIEVPNMSHNREAVKTVINFMYHNIKYAEFNTKCDFCHECGYDGEMQLDDKNEWYCPQCGNRDRKMLTVTRRTCGLNLG